MLHDEISAFRKRFGENLQRSIEPSYFRWKVLGNPRREGFVHFERSGDRIIGSATITPKTLVVNGAAVAGAEIGDTFTDPDFRRRGVFSRCVGACVDFCARSGIEVIYGAPNDQSLPGYRDKLNFPPCPGARVIFMTKHISAERVEARIASRLRLRKGPLTAALAKAYLLCSAPAAAGRRSKRESCDVRPIERFSERLDGRWGNAEARRGLFALRDAAYLNWRFFDAPDEFTVIEARRNDLPIGYIAARFVRDEAGSRCIVSDFIALGDDPTVFAALLSALEARFDERGIDIATLYCTEGSPYHEVLRRRGYRKRAEVPIIVYAGTEAGRRIIDSRAAWHFTMADTDHV